MDHHSKKIRRYLTCAPELTFIVLARPVGPNTPDDDNDPDPKLTNDDVKALPMIGDVNLFFKHQRDEPEFEVECEVMIAGA